MSAPAAARLAWSLWTATTALVTAAAGVLVLSGFAYPDDAFGFPGFAGAIGVVYATVGATIASKRSANAIGWIFLGSGVCAALQEFSTAYGGLAYQEAPASLPAAAHAAWLSNWIWIPYTGGGLIFLLLLFPHGQLPGRRWTGVAALAVVAMLLAFVGEFLQPGPLPAFSFIDNPVTLPGAGSWGNGLAALGWSLFALAGVLAVLGLARRRRRAVGDERQQYKWLVAGGALLGCSFGLGAAGRIVSGEFGTGMPYLLEVVLIVGLVAIPLSVGVAITRYRLYDLDRLISRTVTYSLTVGVLLALYAGGVILMRSVLPLQGDIAVAVSTLAVAALFNPLRKRVQMRVDRRFNRSHYVGRQELEGFAGRMRNELDLEELTRDLVGVVTNTLEPSTVSVWVLSTTRPAR